MKFFKNKTILFKLILCLILCFMVLNVMLKLTVNAADISIAKKNKSDYVDTSQIKENDSSNNQDKVTETNPAQSPYVKNPGTSEASNGSQSNPQRSTASQGGKLLQPIVDLLLTLGDGIMDVMQKAVVGVEGHISLDISGASGWAKFLGALVGILVIVVITVATGGIATWIAGLGGALGTVLTTIGSSGIVSMIISGATLAAGVFAGVTVADGISGTFLPDITILPTYSVSPEEIFEGKLLLFDVNFFNPKQLYVKLEDQDKGIKIQDYDSNNADKEVEYYYYLDDNAKGDVENNRVTTSKQNTALQLSTVISKWYYSIRNIALVGMMLILIYIGIRMMLCSVASEKSKYKKMLGDWVVSMCLVFVLHYIMVFSVNVNENIVDIIEATTEKNQSIEVISLKDMDRKDKFIEAVYTATDGEANEYFLGSDGETIYKKDEAPTKDPRNDKDKIEGFAWPTNLVGRMRILCQYQNGSSEYVGYAIAYLVLVFYTLFFAFTYLKRVLYMAFLTVIAPLVAMTYSIDKISDGKAQAFNIWLKEYIFNLLIQPMHLLLYMLLISMAYELAATNIIYTLVAIGFMIPAEKLVRKMFGFEKASTPGFLGGAAGAALTMETMKSLSRIAGKGPGPKRGAKPVEKLDKSNNDDTRAADKGKGLASLTFADDNNENSPINSGGPSPVAEGAAILEGDGGNTPTASALNGGAGGDNNLPDYDDIRLTEKNTNPMDFLSEDERKEYDIAKARANNSSLEFSELSAANRRKNEIEANAEQRKAAHFQRERANRRMLEESRRRQQEAQETAARRQASSQTMSARLKGGLSKGAKKVIENGDAIAKTIKTGTKLTGAALGGAIGAAAGIASGDIGNAAKYAGLGVTAGASIGTTAGNGIAGAGTSGVDVYKRAKTEHEKDKYGDQYSQHHKNELDEKFFKDKTQRKFYERECSGELNGLTGDARKEALDQIMRDAIKYRQHGVTDNSLIVKARNLDRNNRTSDESIGAAMLATKAKDVATVDKYKEDLTNLWGKDRADRISTKAKKLNGLL